MDDSLCEKYKTLLELVDYENAIDLLSMNWNR